MPRLGDAACPTWGILHALLGGYCLPCSEDTACLLDTNSLHMAINDGDCYLQYTASNVNLTANVLADRTGERMKSRQEIDTSAQIGARQLTTWKSLAVREAGGCGLGVRSKQERWHLEESQMSKFVPALLN